MQLKYVAILPLTLVLVLSSCTNRDSPQPMPTEVVLYSSGASPDVIAIDWNGKQQAAWRRPTADSVSKGSSSSNGSPLAIDAVSLSGDRILTRDGQVRDFRGRRIGTGTVTAGFGPTWADDNTHLCQFAMPGIQSGSHIGPAVLTWITPGDSDRVVTTVGQFGPNSTYAILACSARVSLAVIAIHAAPIQVGSNRIDAVTSVIAVNLGDGSVHFSKNYPVTAGASTTLVASNDGRYLAEMSIGGNGAPNAPTVVREMPSGSEVGSLGPVRAMGFSGDGTALFTLDVTGSQIRRLPTGDVLWQAGYARLAAAQPGSHAFMATKRIIRSGQLQEDLWLVGTSYGDREIAQNVVTVYGRSS